jgi:hypothetical protein
MTPVWVQLHRLADRPIEAAGNALAPMPCSHPTAGVIPASPTGSQNGVGPQENDRGI